MHPSGSMPSIDKPPNNTTLQFYTRQPVTRTLKSYHSVKYLSEACASISVQAPLRLGLEGGKK